MVCLVLLVALSRRCAGLALFIALSRRCAGLFGIVRSLIQEVCWFIWYFSLRCPGGVLICLALIVPLSRRCAGLFGTSRCVVQEVC
jgi:hypothetical protein